MRKDNSRAFLICANNVWNCCKRLFSKCSPTEVSRQMVGGMKVSANFLGAVSPAKFLLIPLLFRVYVQKIMTTTPKPTPLAPLPPPPQPPQNITSAIFQPVVQHAHSRPPPSGPPRDPSKLPVSCKPQDGPGRQLVWMVISSHAN